MAKKKKKSFWKKAAKAALIGGALYAGTKALKGRKGKVDIGSENLNIGSRGPQIPDIHEGLRSNKYKFDTDHLTSGTYAAKGGRIGAKSGGRVKSMGIAKRGGGVAKR
jgi:hypothetical protein